MRIIAGTLKGRRLEAPELAGAAADVRQAARDAVQHPRAAGRRRARAGWLRGHRRGRHRGDQPGRRARHVRRSRPRARPADRARTWRGVAWRTAMLLSAPIWAAPPPAFRRRPSTSSFSIPRTTPIRRSSRGRSARWLAPDGLLIVEYARRTGAPAASTASAHARGDVRRQRAGVLRRLRAKG